jgi:FkbM family methyltransferase
MSYLQVLQTRSFSQEPFGTLYRGVEWMLKKKLSTKTTFEVEFGEYRFNMNLQSAQRKFGSAGIFIQRKYYEPLLEYGHMFLHKGDCAIDGGANQGIYSCAFAAAVGPQGAVYAFEPQEYAVKCIEDNAKTNGFNNITVFPGAVSDSVGTIYLNIDRGPNAAYISEKNEGNNVIEVKTFTIDDLFLSGKMRQVQLIKLDVEGAELKALKGARSMLNAHPVICLEAADLALYTEIAQYLAELKYKPFVFDTKGNLLAFDRFEPSANVFFLP